jgi:hypothetical protein
VVAVNDDVVANRNLADPLGKRLGGLVGSLGTFD